ncbi:MAG: carboxylating nicotinate-nucleotide diphosphorylase [Phycisphaerae bacterium]|nr:carboxylating nicotinate-nucleotide diphosphorylase [Phycisphaerae bacterium]
MRSGQREMANLRRLLDLARAEDLGPGDVTSALLPAGAKAAGRFVARQELVFCGGAFLEMIAAAYDERIRTVVEVGEGERAATGAVLGRWDGPAAPILSAERVALNFLQRLSGIATLTRRYVDAVAGTGAEIFDTRKMTPGWRDLEKYAVRSGGGRNHRRGLYDALLVKDNHLTAMKRAGFDDAIGALADKLAAARKKLGEGGFIGIEVDTLEQFEAALKLPVDIILLDNFSAEDLSRAVAYRRRDDPSGKVALEASGGVTLESVGEVARSGVERIAVGAITHSARAVDIALDLEGL